MVFRKVFSQQLQECFSNTGFNNFVYGGLNHIVFHFLLCFWFSSLFFGACITNCNVSLKLLSCNASLQILIDSLNTSIFYEVSDTRFSMNLRSCSNIFGGWLECRDGLRGGRGGHVPTFFFAVMCFFAITLKNYKLC